MSREHNDLTEITEVWGKYRQAEEDIETAEMMKSDPDFKDMAEEEIKENKALLVELEEQLNVLMIPKDPNDANAAYLEIRAGTGGDEAAIFSGDLFRIKSSYPSENTSSSANLGVMLTIATLEAHARLEAPERIALLLSVDRHGPLLDQPSRL